MTQSTSLYTSSLLRCFDERGYIHQVTDARALDALAAKEKITAYIGFDATAPSLHIGSLVQIMMLRRLQQCGHRPIIVIGGGTSKIGDPSGKDSARQMLSATDIADNIASIRRIFGQFLQFGTETEDGTATEAGSPARSSDALIVDNAAWLDKLSYVEFLQHVGAHFTINRMLTFDSVRLRLEREQPLTFLEFNYMILQAYDFLELARGHDVRLQMGGSDQWGNIVNGIELARRMEGHALYGVTTPLLTTASGAKMGKTADGAVWLNPDQLSAYDYWQYWRNVNDRDVGRFLRLFTDLPLDEIARLEALEGAEINVAKIALADATTALCRGAQVAQSASVTARKFFECGDIGGDLPAVEMPKDGLTIVTALRALGFVSSNKEARRKIDEGAVKLNGETIRDPQYHIVPPAVDIPNAPYTPPILSLGSKRHGRLFRHPSSDQQGS